MVLHTFFIILLLFFSSFVPLLLLIVISLNFLYYLFCSLLFSRHNCAWPLMFTYAYVRRLMLLNGIENYLALRIFQLELL